MVVAATGADVTSQVRRAARRAGRGRTEQRTRTSRPNDGLASRPSAPYRHCGRVNAPLRTGVVSLMAFADVVRRAVTVADVGRGDRKPVRWHNDRVRRAKQRARRRAQRGKAASASPAAVKAESAERPSS